MLRNCLFVARRVLATSALLLASSSLAVAGDSQPGDPAPPPGLGDPGTLESLKIDTARLTNEATVLAGSDARQQLLVSGVYSSGQIKDLAREVSYQVEPDGVVAVDESGMVTPVADGLATITITAESGSTDRTMIAVKDFGHQARVNFPNQIVPIFTKYGCNSGGCHGKASGQNGFKLSLLGFEPTEDYEHLVKEARGRRLFPAAPDRSLLLTKPTGVLPHGGGQKIDLDSYEYRIIRRWIAQGMPYGQDDDPVVTGIEVSPQTATMDAGSQQQVVVVAHYSDGTTEDVTRMTQYDPNVAEMAEVTATGLVSTLDLAGDVAIMARYQGHVGVFRASIPLGYPVEDLPPARNFIDELVFQKLYTLGVPPSPACDDATFIRRVTTDIAGRLPLPAETAQFVADEEPDKRDRWIDSLLASGEYADYFANKWSAILRNKRRNQNYVRGTYVFHSWIRQSLLENKPYDQFVRDILTASGEMGNNPPVAWYREVKSIDQQVEDCAQLFLGLRIQCARCHHHPFEKWSQRDYYGFAAYFSRVGRKPGRQVNEDRIYHNHGAASAQNPKTKQNVTPTGLGAEPAAIAPEDDPRHALVDWLAEEDNAFFSHALVNRYWKHFFSRGLVDPEDDMRATNPASNPDLLDALARHFIASGFDMKDLIRTICTSRVYQLSSLPNAYNVTDKQNFSRYYPKRLSAEVLLDALDQVTASQTKFSGLPLGTRAVQLPDTGANTYFLTVFGKPEGDSACECERSDEANLAQSLHLLNSGEVQGKLSAGSGRASQLAGDKERSHEERITDLYSWTYSRAPVEDEMATALSYIEKKENKQHAYEDILWALVNTKEFLFNH